MVFGVIGGDRRYTALSRLLEEDGHRVWAWGQEGEADGPLPEQVLSAETVVLPMPLCRADGTLNCGGPPLRTEQVFRRLSPWQHLLAGQVRPEQHREAARQGLRLTDYLSYEPLTIANAAITAECALQTAMDRLEGTLLGRSCLVLGFGRIGRLLAFRLHGLGARVSAAARREEDRTWVRAYGWQALDTGRLAGTLSAFGAVFNTIPSPILDRALLEELPRECLLVDLATVPGIDFDTAEALGRSAVWARGLPGRQAPSAAAAAIRDTIYHILEE